jgi:thymidylate kinase
VLIDGVLIEGVDYVGKTSVATRMVELLTERGTPASLGKCYLRRTPLIEFLEEQAKRTESMLERDWYYSAAIMADLYAFEPPGTFVVQDRHWLTQVGRNRFFHPGLELIRPGLLEERHHPFRFNVLLTSSLEAKLERSRSRPPNSPRDRYLAERPTLHQDYEQSLVDLLPASERWTVLDTTRMTIDEVAGAVLELTRH